MSLSLSSPFPLRRIRSFARRDSRITGGQQQAFERLWPQWGLSSAQGLLDFKACFGREAPTHLEIGFGSGASLAAAAEANPARNFIGIETFKPGVGALLAKIDALGLKNLRLYYEDAVEVLEKAIPDNALALLQIFFPDPWPKSRHHKRRLVQAPFMSKVIPKIERGGQLHLATDWQHYANQMMAVLSEEAALINTAAAGAFSARSPYRPLITKFEGRGEAEGRDIWDLQFARL